MPRSHGKKRPSRRENQPQNNSPSLSRQPAQLPGYHYDTVSKRYYKIGTQPGPSNEVPPKQTVACTSKKRRTSSECSDVYAPVKNPGFFPQLLLHRSLSVVADHVFERKAFQLSAFNTKKQMIKTQCHRGTVSHLNLNPSQDLLLASAKSGHGAVLWKYNVSECNKFYIHIKRDDDFTFSPASTISDVTFLPPNVREGSVALISLLGGVGQHGRVSLLDLTQGDFLSTYYVPQANVWSCSWNRHEEHSLCIGASKKGYVQDIVTNNRRVLFTNNSDVLCIRSAARSSCVFTGSRNNLMICHDLRTKEPVYQVHHQSSVGDIHLLKGENAMVCSAFNGQLIQWDLRIQRQVIAYEGHVNDFAPVKMKIDESESLLFVPGKDLHTRVWALDSGALLNTLPPPAEESIVADHNIPAVEVGLNWAGTKPGFALAATGLLHWYCL